MRAILNTYQLARKHMGRRHALGWAVMDIWPTLGR